MDRFDLRAPPLMQLTDSPASRRGGHLVDATMFWSRSGGGVRRYLQAKHDWFASRTEWRHTIAAPIVDMKDMARVPAIPLPMSGGYRLPLRRQALTKVLCGLRPDLIEAGDPYRLAWAALDAGRELDVPVLAFCHSNVELLAEAFCGRLAGPAARWACRYAQRLYSGFDLVLAPSEAMQQHLHDWGITRVVVQPLGVDTTAFHPSRASPLWRLNLGLPADARILLYAGRLAREKRLNVLTEARERLGPRYWLVVIGAGPARGAVTDRDQVLRLPPVASVVDLAEAMASADAFVHAGEQETYGLSVLEALACGTPVVARPVQGLSDLVDEHVGMPVHASSSAAFAAAIEALFSCDRARLGVAARQRALTREWKLVLPQLVRHYEALL